MAEKHPKRPRDLNQWAKRMVDIATGAVEDRELTPEEQSKDPAAVSLGRLGGLKGGKARRRGNDARAALRNCAECGGKKMAQALKVFAVVL
jgi:hypothetical protein